MKVSHRPKIRIRTSELLICYFALTQFGTRIVRMNSLIGNMLIASSGILCLLYCILHSGIVGNKGEGRIYNYNPNISKVILLDILLSFFVGLSIIYNHNQSILDIIWIFSYSGIAVLLYQETIREVIYIRIFYVLSAYFAIAILVGTSLADILAVGSENNVSVYLLLALYMMLLPYQYNNDLIPIVPFAISGLITLWTGSRAGLLSIGTITVCVFLYNSHLKKKPIKRVLTFTILIIVIYLIANKYGSNLFAQTIYKLRNYGATGGTRPLIWSEYIGTIISAPLNLLLGAKTIDAGFWCNVYGGNLHNSILIAHANYGLLIFLGLIICIFMVLFRCMRVKNYVLAMIVFSAVIRSFFDWTSFPGCYDVIFFYMILWITGTKKIRRIIKFENN